jgi:starch synthase
MYADNDERAIFFAKGVVETVLKFQISFMCMVMAAMLPIYMKHYYKNEALFSDTKIVTSVYSQSFEGSLDAEMINKIKLDGVPLDAISS